MRKAVGFLFTVVFFSFSTVYAQVSLLDKVVSLSVVNTPVEDALRQLSLQCSTEFSYNSDIIPEKNVTIYASSQPLLKVLQQMLGKDYIFRSTRNHVIILKKINRNSDYIENTEITISGRVLNAKTLQPIANVTVFDMAFMPSSLSDSTGNFSLKMKQKTDQIACRFSKAGFRDTVVFIGNQNGAIPIISLNPISEAIPRMPIRLTAGIELSDTSSILIVKTFVMQEMLTNSFNAFIADKRIGQISLLPQWGTNRRMSGSVINHFSVNLLAGYSYGVAGLEIGGVANINQQEMNGVQASIFLNVVGGNMSGFQLAGLLNNVRGNVQGVQASLLLNTCVDTVWGTQISGLMNVSGKDVYGAQISLISNIARGNKTGAQVGGLLNYAPRPRFQLGIINIADTSDGIPVGVFNIIKHGYYSLAVLTDEILFTKILFGMGTTKMHSYLGTGSRLFEGENSWELCYGLGTHVWSGHTLSVSTDLLSSIISTGSGFDKSTISRVSFSVKPNIRLLQKIYVGIGPSANIFISATNNASVDSIINNFIGGRGSYMTSVTTQYHVWLGGLAEIRIVL